MAFAEAQLGTELFKHKGVRYVPKVGKWQASIYVTGRERVYLGRFASWDEAVAAYVRAENARRCKLPVRPNLKRVVPTPKPRKPKPAPRRKNACGHTGVSLRPARYVATIVMHGKAIKLGAFHTAEEAGAAYQAAVEKRARGEVP